MKNSVKNFEDKSTFNESKQHEGYDKKSFKDKEPEIDKKLSLIMKHYTLPDSSPLSKPRK